MKPNAAHSSGISESLVKEFTAQGVLMRCCLSSRRTSLYLSLPRSPQRETPKGQSSLNFTGWFLGFLPPLFLARRNRQFARFGRGRFEHGFEQKML